jgi:acyl-CoA thioesterase-2
LCYASDYNILVTALQPHASQAHFGNVQMASLDHAMWFHRKPESFSDWFLYSIEVSSTSNSRGLTSGNIFDQKGNLIATATQEGLMRKKI